MRRAARELSGEKEECGFDLRDGCARRHLFEIPQMFKMMWLMKVVVIRMIVIWHLIVREEGFRIKKSA